MTSNLLQKDDAMTIFVAFVIAVWALIALIAFVRKDK